MTSTSETVLNLLSTNSLKNIKNILLNLRNGLLKDYDDIIALFKSFYNCIHRFLLLFFTQVYYTMIHSYGLKYPPLNFLL